MRKKNEMIDGKEEEGSGGVHTVNGAFCESLAAESEGGIRTPSS